MRKENLNSTIIFSGCIIWCIITMLLGQSISQSTPDLRVWNWISVLEVACGLPFIMLQSKSGFPELFDKQVSNRKRFLIPILTGIVFGILDVLVIKVLQHPQPYDSMPPFLQPFPYSIFLYTSGALSVEVWYRLIPLTLIMWLIGNILLKGKYNNQVFLAAAILTSLREPIEQLPEGNSLFISYALITGFYMNLIQAFYFRKAGFLASLFVRLGHYLVWHILLGIYVQYIELGGS
jgi:hypothetical protein